MDWRGLIGTVAPTLATALGGPMAGVAVAAIARALDLPDASEESLERALSSASPETLVALRRADQEFARTMRELDIDLERVHQADRDSARRREVDTGDRTTPRVLAAVVMSGFLFCVWAILTGRVHNLSDPIVAGLVGTLIGYASAKADQIVSYYFGSSAGSKAKDELLKGRQ
jgi:hypothetical protein